MESTFEEAPHSVQMLEKSKQFASFLGRRSIVPRPISAATEFSDLDDASDLDESPRSLDSGSTASSREELHTPHTPHTIGLGGFEFHFDDKQVEGPVGPHLFRVSPDSFATQLMEREVEDEDDIKKRKSFTAELLFNKSEEVPKTPGSRPFTTLNQAVAELDESKVRSWTPRQVAGWMADAGFDHGVVEKFLIHDISGSVLLDLQFEDLKELDISSFGKRHRVMSSIHHLRNSSLISLESPVARACSKSPRDRTPRTLQRPVRPEEYGVVADSRSTSQRRKGTGTDDVTPAESISIVAIEQLLPKPHKCSKGEDCAKWKKQQRKLAKIQQEFAFEAQKALAEEAENTDNDAAGAKVENVPSIIGSSDVLGAAPSFKITAKRLNEIQVRDPQESVRQFLSFQHISGRNSNIHNPSPPPAASASFNPVVPAGATPAGTPVTSPNHQDELRGQLPKLSIPASEADGTSPERTPAPEFDNPSTPARTARAQLLQDPYHYGGVASPADIYRIDTPLSAADVPVTAYPIDPCERVFSNSVPPEMRYGNAPNLGSSDPIYRVGSTPPAPRRRHTKQSFAPSVTPVREDFPTAPAERQIAHARQPSDILSHSGWMRKRKTTKLMRHEWHDMYFSLAGTRLLMLENDLPERGLPIDYIDVDAYDVHAYSRATSSKLSAAFKKSILGAGYMPSTRQNFAFSLIPDPDKGQGRKTFDRGSKSHHFAVNSCPEKVEWMRRLMLAKAACKNASGNDEI
ncbi:hypothetical protein DV736_g3685, partial [Chaetothyriales sp. CBS 134916]